MLAHGSLRSSLLAKGVPDLDPRWGDVEGGRWGSFPGSDSLMGRFCSQGEQIEKATFSVPTPRFSGNFSSSESKNFLENVSSGTVICLRSLHEIFINYTHTSTADFYPRRPFWFFQPRANLAECLFIFFAGNCLAYGSLSPPFWTWPVRFLLSWASRKSGTKLH